MSLNMVTVTIEATGTPGSTTYPEGHFVFVPDGLAYPGPIGGGPIIPQMVQGYLVNGSASVSLVASDNFTAGVLNYSVIVNIRGIPTVTVKQITINFSNGATQDLWTILTNNGWSPTPLP